MCHSLIPNNDTEEVGNCDICVVLINFKLILNHWRHLVLEMTHFRHQVAQWVHLRVNGDKMEDV